MQNHFIAIFKLFLIKQVIGCSLKNNYREELSHSPAYPPSHIPDPMQPLLMHFDLNVTEVYAPRFAQMILFMSILL